MRENKRIHCLLTENTECSQLRNSNRFLYI